MWRWWRSSGETVTGQGRDSAKDSNYARWDKHSANATTKLGLKRGKPMLNPQKYQEQYTTITNSRVPLTENTSLW